MGRSTRIASPRISPVVTLEEMARTLEESGRYRVLRRLEPRPPIEEEPPASARKAIFLDVETTGLDAGRDEIIELAMAPFYYEPDGRIVGLGPSFHGYHQPSQPISPEITALTGVSDALVQGQQLQAGEVEGFAQDAALIIAHNAAFDRRFMERFFPAFRDKPWACSMAQIDWRSEGFEGVKLDYLAAGAGFFYDKHRALNDCLAAIELLASPLPRSARLGMEQLLERARRPLFRIWAENAPFALKSHLKARGYRWNAEGSTWPRAWYVDVEADNRESELHYLRSEIYQGEIDLMVRKITALERFSERC